ncbi:NuA4 histone acetyltransferase subunit, partial [Tulasnella sp. 427]
MSRTVKTVDPNGMEVETASRGMYVGENGVGRWRAGMEVGNPMSDGLIYDWSATKDIVQDAFTKGMEANPQEHPILVTEPAWNTAANRERMAEIMFEEFQVPAFYIANNPVLSAFAAGKGTALIIDIGKSQASVTPVVDGFVLRKGIAHSSIPALVQNSAHTILAHGDATRPPIDLLPYHLIEKKQTVEQNQLPRFVARDDRIASTTTSWRNWAVQREVEEWMMACGAVLPREYTDDLARSWARKPYEFPTGFNSSFGAERFIPGDIYFTTGHLPPTQSQTQHPATLPELLTTALRASEPDLRPALFNNVVLTGGGACLPGMGDRISYELSKLAGGVSRVEPLIGVYPDNKLTETDVYSKKFDFMFQEICWSGGTARGSAGAYWAAWERSTNCGSASKNGRNTASPLWRH